MDLLIEKEIGSLKVKTMLQEQEEQAEFEIKDKIEKLSVENRKLRHDLGYREKASGRMRSFLTT